MLNCIKMLLFILLIRAKLRNSADIVQTILFCITYTAFANDRESEPGSKSYLVSVLISKE